MKLIYGVNWENRFKLSEIKLILLSHIHELIEDIKSNISEYLLKLCKKSDPMINYVDNCQYFGIIYHQIPDDNIVHYNYVKVFDDISPNFIKRCVNIFHEPYISIVIDSEYSVTQFFYGVYIKDPELYYASDINFTNKNIIVIEREEDVFIGICVEKFDINNLMKLFNKYYVDDYANNEHIINTTLKEHELIAISFPMLMVVYDADGI